MSSIAAKLLGNMNMKGKMKYSMVLKAVVAFSFLMVGCSPTQPADKPICDWNPGYFSVFANDLSRPTVRGDELLCMSARTGDGEFWRLMRLVNTYGKDADYMFIVELVGFEQYYSYVLIVNKGDNTRLFTSTLDPRRSLFGNNDGINPSRRDHLQDGVTIAPGIFHKALQVLESTGLWREETTSSHYTPAGDKFVGSLNPYLIHAYRRIDGKSVDFILAFAHEILTNDFVQGNLNVSVLQDFSKTASYKLLQMMHPISSDGPESKANREYRGQLEKMFNESLSARAVMNVAFMLLEDYSPEEKKSSPEP